MKLLHTADWQLGRAFPSVDGQADRLRQARLDTLSNIVALARRERVDAMLAAGDLLEDNRVESRFVEDMARRLRDSPCPVYLLPGNHDPLTHDSPYRLRSTLFDSPMVVLQQAEPMAIGPAMLYPCPAWARSSPTDPTEWIPPRQAEDGLRIGLAHGPQQGTPDTCGYPIASQAAERRELDYLALGHWHSLKEVGPRTWYCGTPEPTSFAENGGHVLIVELDRPGDPPRVRRESVQTCRWLDEDRSVHSPEDVDLLRRLLEERADTTHTLLRLRLQGSLLQSDTLALDRLLREFDSRFFHLRVENSVSVRGSDKPMFRHPLLRAMAEELNAAQDVEAGRRALSMLSSLVNESQLYWDAS